MRWPFVQLSPQLLRADVVGLGGRRQGQPFGGAGLDLADMSVAPRPGRVTEILIQTLRSVSGCPQGVLNPHSRV